MVTGRSSPGGGRGAQPHLQVPEAEGNRGWGTGMVWAGLAESGWEGLSPRKEAGSGDRAGSGQMGSGDVFHPERRPLQTCAPTQPPAPNLAASLQFRGKSLGEKREGRERNQRRQSRTAKAGTRGEPQARGAPSTAAELGSQVTSGGKASSPSRPREARALTV